MAACAPTDWFLRHRSQANWSKIVESFVLSTETLMNTCIRELKQTVNSEIAGVSGPAKPWRGQ